ncbi:chromosomal replication initiator protein DnaA [Candidatus Gracilibacteria bacterium]|nr:chromosomal replication initiator protein DnaA [Candidatus Gracilibacteria bacterium]
MSQVFTFTHLESAIKNIASSIRKQDFLTYFKKFSLVSVTDSSVTLGVVSGFHRDNLIKKFKDDIDKAICSMELGIETIEIIVDEEIDTRDATHVVDCKNLLKEAEKTIKKQQVEGVEIVEGLNSRLTNDRYRLDNFIIGPGTQLAHAACEAVARRPGNSYNPLYLYGNVGLGKTHLLQASANVIREKHKNLKVIYTTADRFLTDYVASIKGRSIDRLREKYRQIDVLVIDDVQFLAGKKQTQEELYNIFNILYEAGKQIILSGDRPPKELTELEPRLQSRFEWGITVDLGEPDYETRLAIIQEKSRAREFILEQEVAEFIAENVTNNVREIEGVLNQIIAEYDLKHTPPTLENVAYRLSKLAVRSITHSLTESRAIRPGNCGYEDLLQAVSTHFGIEIRMLLSEDRKKENMIPRQVAMYLLKNRLHYTYERIGNIFSGRNHTAVMYSCKKLEQVMKKDQQVVYEVNVIRDKLGI